MNPDPNLMSVRLKFACPFDCACNSKQIREWYHSQCLQPSYMTSKGDIFCNQKNCSSYFIKDARFQCQEAQKNKTHYQYKSVSQFLIALGLAMQASDYTLKSETDKQAFTKDILTEVNNRWNS